MLQVCIESFSKLCFTFATIHSSTFLLSLLFAGVQYTCIWLIVVACYYYTTPLVDPSVQKPTANVVLLLLLDFTTFCLVVVVNTLEFMLASKSV